MRALGAKVYAKAVENHIASSVVFVAATIQMLILTKKFERKVLRDCKEGTCITLRNTVSATSLFCLVLSTDLHLHHM